VDSILPIFPLDIDKHLFVIYRVYCCDYYYYFGLFDYLFVHHHDIFYPTIIGVCLRNSLLDVANIVYFSSAYVPIAFPNIGSQDFQYLWRNLTSFNLNLNNYFGV